MTQVDLSERLGVTFQMAQKYERGDNNMSARSLRLAARVFGVPMERLTDNAETDARPAMRKTEPGMV